MCQQLATESCPCFLAAIKACGYCGMLQDQMACHCDWQGYCAYEQLRWREKPQIPVADNVIAAVFTAQNKLGLIFKPGDGLGDTPPGSVLTLKLRAGYMLSGIVLRRFRDHQLLYLACFTPYPAASLPGQQVTATLAGNAFTGHAALLPGNKKILIIAPDNLAQEAAQLAAGLEEAGNSTKIATAFTASYPADVVFMAGAENEIKKAVMALPPSFKGQVTTWVTAGISLQ